MILRLSCLCVILSSCTGCSERVVPCGIDGGITDLIKRIGHESTVDFHRQLNDQINEISNPEVRLACYALQLSKLRSLKVETDDYHYYARVFRTAEEYMDEAVERMAELGLTHEEVLNARIGRFEWMQAQLDKWKPTRRVDYASMDKDEREGYDAWRSAYLACFRLFEMRIEMTEKYISLDCLPWTNGWTQNEKMMVRERLQAFLCRQLRSAADIHSARKTASEEISAVRRREIGPPPRDRVR